MSSKVSQEMVVDVPVERFWEVVADYGAYPGFVPSVKRTRVVHLEKGVKDVAYEVDLGVKTIKYTLRHLESAPSKMTWSLRKGEMMKVSNGAWELSNHAGKTLARYTVEVQVQKPPLVPQAIVDRVSDELTKVQLPRTLAAFKARAEKG
ncbi:MAG: SRPBCC family protein [Deltaproteobacteria bacterium]|nr:SRPBCC family protein [Deltaproteobacteria bacterium]